MLVLFLERLGIPDSTLLLNSVGCPICRPEYLKKLKHALQAVKSTMCEDCQRRADTNPLRVFDCKVEADQPEIAKLPHMLDNLCPECLQHFESVKGDLEQRAIKFQIEPRLVRGLDYYTRTTFEVSHGALGAQNALLGGGRYDGLSEMLGGPPTPGIGFAIGQDRLILAVEQAGHIKPEPLGAFIAWMSHEGLAPAATLARELRRHNITTELLYGAVKMKKSLGMASKMNARFAIIIGENELASGMYQVKDMSTGEQEAMSPAQIPAHLKVKLDK
jgi:histidyl-tRNA synthetase